MDDPFADFFGDSKPASGEQGRELTAVHPAQQTCTPLVDLFAGTANDPGTVPWPSATTMPGSNCDKGGPISTATGSASSAVASFADIFGGEELHAPKLPDAFNPFSNAAPAASLEVMFGSFSTMGEPPTAPAPQGFGAGSSAGNSSEMFDFGSQPNLLEASPPPRIFSSNFVEADPAEALPAPHAHQQLPAAQVSSSARRPPSAPAPEIPQRGQEVDWLGQSMQGLGGLGCTAPTAPELSPQVMQKLDRLWAMAPSAVLENSEASQGDERCAEGANGSDDTIGLLREAERGSGQGLCACRSIAGKGRVLELALKVGDSQTVLRVVTWLASTLKCSALANLIESRARATRLWVCYLRGAERFAEADELLSHIRTVPCRPVSASLRRPCPVAVTAVAECELVTGGAFSVQRRRACGAASDKHDAGTHADTRLPCTRGERAEGAGASPLPKLMRPAETPWYAKRQPGSPAMRQSGL